MPLQSKLFAGDPRLQACLTTDSAHVTAGARGEHVGKIQTALSVLHPAPAIARAEILAETYGPSTAAAVLAFKRDRRIINPAYQSQADDIVGKMTIAALDAELVAFERRPQPQTPGNGFHFATINLRPTGRK